MNEALSGGCDIVTGYRNSKNFGDNWISAGYSLWFLRESRLLNHARDILRDERGGLRDRIRLAQESSSSGAEDGTASCSPRTYSSPRSRFLPGSGSVTRRTLCSSTNSRPTLFQSFRQRRRWVRGSLQVFAKYGKRLLRGCPRDFACYDMIVNMLSGAVAGFAGMFMGVGAAVVRLCERDIIGGCGRAHASDGLRVYRARRSRRGHDDGGMEENPLCGEKENHVCIHLPALHGDLPANLRLGALHRRRMGAGRHRVCVSVSDISGGDAA